MFEDSPVGLLPIAPVDVTCRRRMIENLASIRNRRQAVLRLRRNSSLDSNTVTDILTFMNRWTVQELAETVNAWCRDRALQPANGQTASELSARTLHYYRSAGLLDAPESGAGHGYGQRHLLQLKAIRILQAQGLPLSRIQQLLFARSDKELEQIAESAGKIDPRPTNVCSRTFASTETWTVYPLNEDVFVVARNGGHLSTSQLEAIGKICNAPPKKSSKSTLTR
jgi:DNA-binding transcriptional MerR regulator